MVYTMYMKKVLFLSLLALILSASPVIATHSALELTHFEVVEEVEKSGLLEATLEENRGLTLGFVVLAGLVDGSNICALSILLLFAGYLAVHVKDRKRSMKIGFIFLGTIFLSYFLAGVALSATIQSLLAWESFGVFQAALNGALVAILALAGILNFQDFFFSKKFIFDVDASKRKSIRATLRYIDIPTTIGLGILSTLFLLPCSLPIYLASVGTLSQVFGQGAMIGYVAIYALMFILPLLVMFAVILRAEKVASQKEIHSGKYKWLKLVKGLIQIGAAVGLFFLLG